VIKVLREIPDSDLADLALSHGFSDQSHMTRECKKIAKITPKVFTKRVLLQNISLESLTHLFQK
jgi:AraC-like DNA-binding protein